MQFANGIQSASQPVFVVLATLHNCEENDFLDGELYEIVL